MDTERLPGGHTRTDLIHILEAGVTRFGNSLDVRAEEA